jgi:multidrug efflux system outer membrane protein
VAVADNRRAVDLAMKLYIAGKTDFLNVLTAQLNLYTSETALVQSSTAVDTDLISLYKALGGGWEQASATPKPAAQPSPLSKNATKKIVTD